MKQRSKICFQIPIRVTTFLMAVLVASAFIVSSEAGPIIVGGGGGTSEFYLGLSLKNYPRWIELCLSQDKCARGISGQLLAWKTAGFDTRTSLIFVDSSELGGHIFRWSGTHLLKINKDFLYKSSKGKREAFEFKDAMNLLIQAWGQTLNWSALEAGTVKSQFSDLLSANFIQVRHSETKLSDFSLVLFSQSVSSLIIENSSIDPAALSVEVPFHSALSCLNSAGINGVPRDLSMRSAHWGAASFRDEVNAKILVLGRLSYTCPDSSGKKSAFRSKYRIYVDAIKGTHGWQLDPVSMFIEQLDIQAEPQN